MDDLEFSVAEAGEPRLDAPEASETPVQPLNTPAPTGWTQDEAAQVVGGWLSTGFAVAYLVRWQAPPGHELWPAIAGDPKSEFPILGATLAPLLDFLAPKGSAMAVGVGASAGIGELIGALARRSQVLSVPPPQRQERPAQPASPPAQEESGNFKFTQQDLSVFAGMAG